MSIPRDPFAVSLTDDQKGAFAKWLGNELRNAIAARAANERDVDYYWTLYEQGRTRSTQNLPWPDAADLTSYIPCEKVDAIQSRLVRTVMVNPVYIVEGWGDAADRAPFVEEFHQWKVEEERLQRVLDKVALTALVEPRCLVEVYENTQTRTTRKTITAKTQQTDEGGLILDEQGQPQLQTGPDGKYLEASGSDLGAQTVIDTTDQVRIGPQYRVLPYADSLVLPGHARDEDEVWGYAKRIYKRKSDLSADASGDDAIYDADAVDKLTDVGDREPTPSLSRAGQSIAPQSDTQTAEKELWECLVQVDLSDLLDRLHQSPVRGLAQAGSRWYVVTLHAKDDLLLRIQHDDFDSSRYVNFILFPRHDRVTEGYSFIGHKLLTVTEEHTAYRNMAADRTSMAVNAPIMKMSGSLWDEDEQPMGPKAVITVRSPQEITQLQVADVPASVFGSIDRCERTSDRLAGINDIASGQVEEESRTLGEIQMATEQSFVRMDLIVRRFQEAMEDLGQIRHAIWKRALAEQPDGVEAPQSLMVGLEGRGVSIDQYLPNKKVTAALLDGAFRFRPYGSVQTADPAKRRADLLGFAQITGQLSQQYPYIAQQMQTPQAGRALMRELVQGFGVRNPQAFLGSPSNDVNGPPQGMPASPQMPGADHGKAQADAKVQSAQIQSDTAKTLAIMDHATSIAVAKIAAESKSGMQASEAQDEAIALGQQQQHDVNMSLLGHVQNLHAAQQQADLAPPPAPSTPGSGADTGA